jgi:hypothetical protein
VDARDRYVEPGILFRPDNDAAPTSDSAYQAKLDALADTINHLAPDVLAVQEVGGPEPLDDSSPNSAATGIQH